MYCMAYYLCQRFQSLVIRPLRAGLRTRLQLAVIVVQYLLYYSIYSVCMTALWLMGFSYVVIAIVHEIQQLHSHRLLMYSSLQQLPVIHIHHTYKAIMQHQISCLNNLQYRKRGKIHQAKLLRFSRFSRVPRKFSCEYKSFSLITVNNKHFQGNMKVFPRKLHWV